VIFDLETLQPIYYSIALIGALLGVPVSYMGVRRAAKAKADWITGIMEQQNAFINQPLLTFNPSVPSGSPSLEEFKTKFPVLEDGD